MISALWLLPTVMLAATFGFLLSGIARANREDEASRYE